MHYLFNVVSGQQDFAQAVLIRSIQPTIGIDEILVRRNQSKINPNVCNGPAKVCQALGITKIQNAISLLGNEIWLEPTSTIIQEEQIQISPRIGIDYAEEDKHLPWRFVLKI